MNTSFSAPAGSLKLPAKTPAICLMTETYFPVVGGGETQTRIMAADLLARGFPISIVTRQSSRTLKKTDEVANVRVYRTKPAGEGHLKRWGMIFGCLPVLWKTRHQYNLIFVSGFKALGIPAVLFSKLLRKACILKADSMGEMSGAFFSDGLRMIGLTDSSTAFRIFIACRNHVLRKADYLIALTSEMADEFRENGIRSDKILQIPNSVDTVRFSPISDIRRRELRDRLGLPQNHCIVAYTGRLVSYKGLPMLLHVWRRIHRENSFATLLLIGSGGLDIHNCEPELKEYAASAGLQDCVRFVGDIQNVHEFLQTSDIFAFPSEREAFGISPVEAMACGLPVIATFTGAIKEIIIHGHNGFIIKSGSFDELYQCIHLLIQNKSLAESMGQSAREAVVARYSRETVARCYEALFEKFSTPEN